MLILVQGCPHITPHMEAFEWITGWIHKWGLPNYMVSDEVDRIFHNKPDILIVQQKEVIADGHKCYRVRIRINIWNPLKKWFYIHHLEILQEDYFTMSECPSFASIVVVLAINDQLALYLLCRCLTMIWLMMTGLMLPQGHPSFCGVLTLMKRSILIFQATTQWIQNCWNWPWIGLQTRQHGPPSITDNWSSPGPPKFCKSSHRPHHKTSHHHTRKVKKAKWQLNYENGPHQQPRWPVAQLVLWVILIH